MIVDEISGNLYFFVLVAEISVYPYSFKFSSRLVPLSINFIYFMPSEYPPTVNSYFFITEI